MSDKQRTIFMLAAVVALGYALLRSSNASAAAPSSEGASVGAGTSTGAGGSSLGSTLSQAIGSALGSIFDPPAQSSGSAAGTGSSGSSGQSTPLPVSGVTQVQDAPRVAAAVASTGQVDYEGYSSDPNKRVKQENSD